MPIQPIYRTLNADELQTLEKEFIDFLVVNGVMADDWVKLKTDEPDKAEDFITLFSDVIMEGVMRKITYLEYHDKQNIMAFHCQREQLVLVALESQSGLDLDLDQIKAGQFDFSKVKGYTTQKTYTKKREHELFDMIQSGCLLADDSLYKAIALSLTP